MTTIELDHETYEKFSFAVYHAKDDKGNYVLYLPDDNGWYTFGTVRIGPDAHARRLLGCKQ